MSTLRRLLTAVLALAAVAACSSPVAEDPVTTTTTVTVPPTTTTLPPPQHTAYIIDVTLDGDPEARLALAAFYGWIGDRTLTEPDIPSGLLAVVGALEPDRHLTVEATLVTAELEKELGRVGIATADDDIVLLADDGSGWKVVGAFLPRFDMDPWYGEPVRHVLIVGTDARPGQAQDLFRADSIHILSSNLPEGRGAVLGFPRDAYVQASYGMDKFTHVNALSDRHTAEMVDIAAALSGLPIDGYLVTGFVGFIGLVNDFGGVVVDVPYRMNDWRAEADLYAGTQRLWGAAALAFSRIRSIPGGDFTRSGHQGVVVLAALSEIAGRDITRLPELLSILTRHTWTNLSPGDLLTLGAAGFVVDPDTVENKVLPGTAAIRGGASVVVLDEVRSEEMFRDLDDGFFDPPDG
ncbi:MAG TPA: LCP family protein [Acidimicrobiia bacterium]|nr:LCP family protein [Acidimicrobiia bacterium]